MHIQQVKLEADAGGAYQPKEQLGEVGLEPTQRDMAATELSQGKDEKQLSDRTVKLNFAAEWTLSATEDEEDDMGDHDDLPICKEEMQPRRLHTQS
jgi:hypothetical protein